MALKKDNPDVAAAEQAAAEQELTKAADEPEQVKVVVMKNDLFHPFKKMWFYCGRPVTAERDSWIDSQIEAKIMTEV